MEITSHSVGRGWSSIGNEEVADNGAKTRQGTAYTPQGTVEVYSEYNEKWGDTTSLRMFYGGRNWQFLDDRYRSTVALSRLAFSFARQVADQ